MRVNAFVKHVLTLSFGNAGTMAISLLAAPIISRLFVPEDFGAAALFVTLVMLGGSVAGLNYERAILLPKSRDKSLRLVSISFRAMALVSLALLVIATVLWLLGLPIPFENQLGAWVWGLPLAIWLSGMSSIVLTILTRSKEYRSIAQLTFWQGLITTSGRISAGSIWGSSVSGLIAGFLLGFAAFLTLVRRRSGQIREYFSTRRHLKDLCRIAVEYSDFPVYSMPATFATRFSSRLPIIVIGAMFTPDILGFYAMADRLVRTPLLGVGQAISRVYAQRAAALVCSGNDLRVPFLKTSIGLAATGLVPLGILYCFGTQSAYLILGDRWITAGTYVEISHRGTTQSGWAPYPRQL